MQGCLALHTVFKGVIETPEQSTTQIFGGDENPLRLPPAEGRKGGESKIIINP